MLATVVAIAAVAAFKVGISKQFIGQEHWYYVGQLCIYGIKVTIYCLLAKMEEGMASNNHILQVQMMESTDPPTLVWPHF